MILGSEFGGETAGGGLIENYPGIEVDGFDLMMSMKDQVLKYDVELFEENALKIEQSDDAFNVHTDSAIINTKSVILVLEEKEENCIYQMKILLLKRCIILLYL